MKDMSHSNALSTITQNNGSGELVSDLDAGSLSDLIIPPASPEQIRSLYATRQRYYTALLDPNHDFLYAVSYSESGKQREYMTTSLDSAQKFAERYGVSYKARPRRSGIEKLAEGLGIEAQIVEQRGLPFEKSETFAWVRCVATHRKTGRSAYGIGYCDSLERPYMTKHAVIATADSRAFARAVLRLIGYGEVGADEIMAGMADEDVDVVMDSPLATQPSKAERKPELREPAESIAAAQAVAAQEQRPNPRPVTSAATHQTSSASTPQTSRAQETKTERPVHEIWAERKGGSFVEEPPEMPMITSNDPNAPALSQAQRKELSEKIISAFEGDRTLASLFLKQHAGVQNTGELKVDQIDRLISRLNYITTGMPF